jgi:ribosomal protein L11 methyltransferase
VPAVDWSEAWKVGLGPTQISPRLRLRPSFVAPRSGPGAVELVIDPGMAFGTGGHATTRLALSWIDAIADSLPPGARALDLGTGTGVLALAAAALAGARAVACDLDRDAVAAARGNAAANGLSGRCAFFVGSVGALRPAAFDLVVANLLRRELAPLLGPIARALRAGGRAVFSGLLAQEAGEVEGACARAGLERAAAPRSAESNGERWTALLMRRAAPGTSPAGA